MDDTQPEDDSPLEHGTPLADGTPPEDGITRGIFEIKVYRDLCKACGLCVAWCPQDVLATDAENYPLTPGLDRCIGCKLCEWHCPDFAIEIIAPGSEVVDVDSLLHAR